MKCKIPERLSLNCSAVSAPQGAVGGELVAALRELAAEQLDQSLVGQPRLLQADDVQAAFVQPSKQPRQPLFRRVDVPGRDPHRLYHPTMGGRSGRTLFSALSTCAVLLLAAAPAGAVSDMEPERAVQSLNEWRAAVGVPPVIHDPLMSAGCRAHAEYYRLNPDTFGHYEEASRRGYSAAGQEAAASSVLSYGGGKRGPYTWEPTAYHRASLLNPRLATSGFWAEHELACMNAVDIDIYRTTPTLTSYPYPYDGQTDVGTEFPCLEVPNPCDNLPRGTDPGFLLTVLFNGPWKGLGGLGAEVAAASLVPDGGGAPVPLTVEDRDSGLYASSGLDGGLLLIPNHHLAEGTWYTAAVSGSYHATGYSEEQSETTTPFSLSWRFRTQVVPPPFSSPGLNVTMLRGKARISSRNPNPVSLTMQRGRSKRQTKTLALRPAGRGTFARVIPARIRSVHWRVCARQAKQLEERWNRGQDCEHGAPMGLASTVLWSNRTFVRLRIKAPSLTHGRKATVLLLGPGGSVLDRARVTLTEKSRVDLSGPAGSRAVAVRILVRRFVRQGIPRRVLPETIRLSEVAKERR